MNLLYNIFFFAIFDSVCFFVICQNIPNARKYQASTLVSTRFYFFGGFSATGASNEVWYLDLSNSFNITIPPWHKDVGMPVKNLFGSSCVSPIDNSTVFTVGGMTYDLNAGKYLYSTSIFVFNTKTSQWTIPIMNNFNSSFANRIYMQAIINNDGKIFIFGGSNFSTLTSDYYNFNDMNILEITTMTWSTLILPQSMLNYISYTATLLSNGLIVYIGGREGTDLTLKFANMNEIRTFDTKSYIWSIKITSGSIISQRIVHSAVLTQNGDIIVYGGAGMLNSTGYVNLTLSDIAVLNTNTWVWSVPIVSGNSPPPLYSHSATIYQNYMIITFGAISSTTFSNNIYILNTQNYIWVTTASLTTSASPTTDIKSANNNNLYIGIGVGVVIFIGILITAGLLIYKKRPNEILEIPGTST